MIDRVEEKFAIKPRRLVGDTNYGVAAMLEWLVNEKRIAPHVPVWIIRASRRHFQSC